VSGVATAVLLQWPYCRGNRKVGIRYTSVASGIGFIHTASSRWNYQISFQSAARAVRPSACGIKACALRSSQWCPRSSCVQEESVHTITL